MEKTVITFSAENFITINIMVLVGGLFIATLAKLAGAKNRA
jgi:hypothetical protein